MTSYPAIDILSIVRSDFLNIGERIKKLRNELGLTQDDLAISANTTKQTIHKYETGIISNIPASKIKALADKLNTTPAYLMGWEDKISSYSDDELDQKIVEVFNRLSEEKQKQALDYLAFLASQE